MGSMSDEHGLTPYILTLLKHPDLARADPVKAADMFGIKLEWAVEYLNRERERRRSMK